MEQLKSVLHDIMICHDSNEMKKGHDIGHDISLSNQEMISKNDYHYLVQVLEGWRVFYPKAQIKKYGAKNCWIAMQRVKSSNARTPGAYFTITVRNLIKEERSRGDLTPLKNEKGMITPKTNLTPVKNDCDLPQIDNWMQARQFICDVYEGKIKQNDNVIELMNQVKRKYNFA